MRGKPKTRPNTEERAQITTMSAAGVSQQKIARAVGRSRHMVQNVLAEPEIQRAVKDEKAELSQLYREKARDVLVSIDADTIKKANLLQKATSSAILLDKSLLLVGDSTINVNVQVLLEVCEAIRTQGNEESKRQLQQAQARLSLPAEQA